MNLLQRLEYWWAWRGYRAPDVPASRCLNGRVRHLFLGERYCQRCRAENARWKPLDLLQAAREVAAHAEHAE